MKKHQTTIGKSNEYLTPPEILKALGSFDLDPCAPISGPFTTAKSIYYENGLIQKWHGRVWLNPPFDRRERPNWMKKMAEHNNGIMLVPGACETDAFYKYVWNKTSGVLFLKGRPHFYYIDGTRAKANSGCTICLVAYGEDNLISLEKSGLGVVVNNFQHYHDSNIILQKELVSKTNKIIELKQELNRLKIINP